VNVVAREGGMVPAGVGGAMGGGVASEHGNRS
jgi:hypothetical protein